DVFPLIAEYLRTVESATTTELAEAIGVPTPRLGVMLANNRSQYEKYGFTRSGHFTAKSDNGHATTVVAYRALKQGEADIRHENEIHIDRTPATPTQPVTPASTLEERLAAARATVKRLEEAILAESEVAELERTLAEKRARLA